MEPLIKSDKIKVFSEFFTPSLSERYKNKKFLLISDIRTPQIENPNPSELIKNELSIIENNLLQIDIVKNFTPIPIVSFLKFRCIFPNILDKSEETTVMLNPQKIFLQP